MIRLNLDEDLHNADWTKTEWDLPPYKSDEFYKMLAKSSMSLEGFRKLPVYKHAVDKGLIKDDEWVGEDG
jgi:hypothetical protein